MPRKPDLTTEEILRLKARFDQEQAPPGEPPLPPKQSSALRDLEDENSPIVDTTDTDRIKKHIMVMGLRLMQLYMRDPGVPIGEKMKIYLQASGQWEGTRREIVWDTRKLDDKVLLAEREQLVKKLVTLGSKMPPELRAKFELDGAVAALTIDSKDKPN